MYSIKMLSFIITITFSCFLFSQKSKNQIDTLENIINDVCKLDVVVSRLKLTHLEKNKLITKCDIINQLYLTTNDSLKYIQTRKWLDSYFLKKINEKKLVTALELERHMIKGTSFSFIEANDTTGIEKINDPSDIIKMINEIHESASQVVVKTEPKNEAEISESEKKRLLNTTEFKEIKQAYFNFSELKKEWNKWEKELKEGSITKENYDSEIMILNSKSKILLSNIQIKKRVLYDKHPNIAKDLIDDSIFE